VRPPYGAHSGRVDAVIRSQGWIPLLWSVDPQDWRGGSPPAIASYVLGRLHPGAVILLHDGIRRSGITAEALPAIIDGARLGARRTIVVGGRGVVPDAAVAGLPAVERLAGGERTATAAAVATRARELGLAGPPLLVSAERFPDGLAAGVLAGAVLRAPLLSTQRDELSPPVYPWLASYGTGALTVVGGPVAVSPRVRCQIVTGFQYSFLCP